MKRAIVVLGFLTCAACVRVEADSPAPEIQMVTSSPQGSCYFVMVPATYRREGDRWVIERQAFGVAYRIKHGGVSEELWRTEGWYSFRVFPSDDGRHFVRLSPWNSGGEPKPGDLAVAFYDDGKLLKQYWTSDLVKDPSKVRASVSHYMWLASDTWDSDEQFDRGAEPQLGGGSTDFSLKTVDGILYRFDIRTGEIKSATPPRSTSPDWASPREIRRLVRAIALVEFPFPETKIDEIIGLPRSVDLKTIPRPAPNGTIVYETTVALNPPGEGQPYHALRWESRDRVSAEIGNAVERDVIAMSLHFVDDAGTWTFQGPTDEIRAMLRAVKQEMKQDGKTPREVSERLVRD